MKRNSILLCGLVICFVLDTSAVAAQQVSIAPIKQDTRIPVNTNSSVNKQLQEELKQKASEALKEFTQKREEIKKEIDKNREEFKKDIAEKKTEATKIKTAKRAELAEKLKIIKDEKKQQIVLKIGDQFQQINNKVLANITNLLVKEESILQKISSRADSIGFQNSSSTDLKGSIALANADLAKAREAIVAQTAKVYTIAIKTEATLKNDTSITKQLLEKDLNNVRNFAKAAHESVKRAAEVLKRIPGIENIKILQSTSTSSSNN